MSVKAVLFDLDGTLLDTAPDLAFALNRLRAEQDLPPLPLSALRPAANLGSKAMLNLAFGIDEKDPSFNDLRQRFLALYEQHMTDSTQFFPGIEAVLDHLEEKEIPWGIVTNKLKRHTDGLLAALSLNKRAGCVICGDTLSTFKPDPAPILYACQLLKHVPADCIYVGDSATDVIASKAAGVRSVVALYGYNGDEDPRAWQADGCYLNQPIDLITWLSGSR